MENLESKMEINDVKFLYDLADKLTEQFKRSLASDEQDLVGAFRNYLLLHIEGDSKSNLRFSNDIIASSMMQTTNDFMEYPSDIKRKLLLKDDALEEIKKISGMAFSEAQLVLFESKNTSLSKEQIDLKQKEILNLLGKVQPYNKEEAKMIVSETILDLNLLANPKSEVLSLRLGRFLDVRKKV